MLSDKKYGLSVNMMATRVMPSLLPQTVNPSLNLEQFMILLEVRFVHVFHPTPRMCLMEKAFNLIQVLQEMLDCIDRQQRNKLKLDNLSLPSPERHRPLRHQFSSDNMHVPPFNIPNLRIDQRKTSSAEDMARKNSTGSISKQQFLSFTHSPARSLAFHPSMFYVSNHKLQATWPLPIPNKISPQPTHQQLEIFNLIKWLV